MIIARSPLRISFAGGGTDLPVFYEKYGWGAVVSTSINCYVYVTLNKKFDGKVSVRYSIHENCDQVIELKHALIRETLLNYGVTNGIEIVIVSEVPARGSGLGASSALTSALCLCLAEYQGKVDNDKESIAEGASYIEIERVGSPIGKQDHYSSALGGLNFFRFTKRKVEIKSFPRTDFVEELEGQSMLFSLNMEREYKDGSFVHKILREQMDSIDSMNQIYQMQRDNALRLWEHMQYEVIERFMDHVNENWRLKRKTHPEITNPAIDSIIQRALSAGATAAKVCGAGGGGFLYLMVPPSMQGNVRSQLEELHELRFRFDTKGAEVIFSDMENYAYADR